MESCNIRSSVQSSHLQLGWSSFFLKTCCTHNHPSSSKYLLMELISTFSSRQSLSTLSGLASTDVSVRRVPVRAASASLAVTKHISSFLFLAIVFSLLKRVGPVANLCLFNLQSFGLPLFGIFGGSFIFSSVLVVVGWTCGSCVDSSRRSWRSSSGCCTSSVASVCVFAVSSTVSMAGVDVSSAHGAFQTPSLFLYPLVFVHWAGGRRAIWGSRGHAPTWSWSCAGQAEPILPGRHAGQRATSFFLIEAPPLRPTPIKHIWWSH